MEIIDISPLLADSQEVMSDVYVLSAVVLYMSQRMQCIRNMAEEIVLNELIYR